MDLCSDLLQSPEITDEFWVLRQKEEDFGIVSLWNTALEYFPFNFDALSILSAGLAQAGKSNIRNVSNKYNLCLVLYYCEYVTYKQFSSRVFRFNL